jgi:hypothetical protein
MFASSKNNLSAAHRPPVRRAGNATSCAPQRRASLRARPRALNVTNNDIESIRKQTTDEAIVGSAEFATPDAICTPRIAYSGTLNGLNMALNWANASHAEALRHQLPWKFSTVCRIHPGVSARSVV